MISFKLHVVFQEGMMADGKESIAEKYITGWRCLFAKKKKSAMINTFKVKECFHKDLKKILNMFLFCKLFKIYVVVNNIDTLNEKKFLNDSNARIILTSCIS